MTSKVKNENLYQKLIYQNIPLFVFNNLSYKIFFYRNQVKMLERRLSGKISETEQYDVNKSS